MTEPLCPKCETPMVKRQPFVARRNAQSPEPEWVCPYQPRLCRIRELERLLEAEQTAHAETRKALEEAVEALVWCGGSPDFCPGGQARKGWEAGPMKVINAALARSAQRKENT